MFKNNEKTKILIYLGENMRKFEIVKDEAIEYGEKDIIMPKRATKNSAGYDICSPTDIVIPAGGIVTVWTNLKACCNENEFILLCVRSSMGRKDICLANDIGVIDGDYYSNPSNDGNIGVALKNRGTKDFQIHKNDKIAQIIFVPYLKVDNEEEVNSTRSGGYGSTNK